MLVSSIDMPDQEELDWGTLLPNDAGHPHPLGPSHWFLHFRYCGYPPSIGG